MVLSAVWFDAIIIHLKLNIVKHFPQKYSSLLHIYTYVKMRHRNLSILYKYIRNRQTFTLLKAWNQRQNTLIHEPNPWNLILWLHNYYAKHEYMQVIIHEYIRASMYLTDFCTEILPTLIIKKYKNAAEIHNTVTIVLYNTN